MKASAAQAFASRYVAALISQSPLEKAGLSDEQYAAITRALVGMHKRLIMEADLLDQIETPSTDE